MTATIRPEPIVSPCSRICALDPAAALCRGCGRSLAEITAWIGYDDHARTRIMAELPQRLAQLRAAQAKPAHRR